MIKVGLIGCGKISRGHIDAFKEIPDAAITAACDLNEEALRSVCEEICAKGYVDYKEMVQKEDLDLVIINLPHGLHGEATCFCAERGVDVFLEKPMGISSDDCKKMIDTCKKNNVMLWVGHPQRYMSSNILIKQIIDSGKYGKLIGMHETRQENYFAESRPRWFLTKKMSGGGMMMNLGAHALDKLKFFTGASISEISGQVHIRDGYDCEDFAQAVVKMENGVVCTIDMIGTTAAAKYETILYFTEGEIRKSGFGNTIRFCGKDGVFEDFAATGKDHMTAQMEEVISVIRDGSKKPAVSGEYGLEIIHAIKQLYGEESR